MILRLLTDAQARERYPDDAASWDEGDADAVAHGYEVKCSDHGAGALGAGVYDRFAELARLLPESAEVIVCRDWEGCLFAEVIGGDEVGLDVLALTTRGAIGHGGVNQPRYFDSLLALLAGGMIRTAARGFRS